MPAATQLVVTRREGDASKARTHLTMLITTLVIFGIAAVLGLTVATQIFQKRETSKGVAVAHGLFGAVALVLLILHAVKSPHQWLTTAIILLVVAALGGAIVFVNDLRKKPGPLGLIVIHALVAVVAVVLVLLVAIK
jgi:peptidoglycan/LPS O-acetylase OafA/YrhL